MKLLALVPGLYSSCSKEESLFDLKKLHLRQTGSGPEFLFLPQFVPQISAIGVAWQQLYE